MKDELDDSREKKGNGLVGTSSEVCAKQRSTQSTVLEWKAEDQCWDWEMGDTRWWSL